jgi:hypothetical protein
VAARTDQDRAGLIAAREGVIAARRALVEEAGEMRRSALEAVNLPAKAKEDPLRYGTLGAATAFLVLGGPRRVLGRLRRALLGAPAPKSLLPREIEQAVEGMGRDGAAVRAQLDREFARYLQERRAERERSRLTTLLLGAAGSAASAFSTRAARELVIRLLEPRERSDDGGTPGRRGP